MLTIPVVQARKTLVATWVVLLFTVLFGLVSVRPAKAEISRTEMGLGALNENTEVDSDGSSDEGRVLAAVAYAPLSLTTAGNQALKFDVTALEIQNGTWTYKASWVRTLDRQGSVYVTPKTNRNNIVKSVAVAAKAGELTADLAPATRYRVEFYSQPNAQGTLLLRKYFNTLDQNGNTVATADIPADRGGSKDVTAAGAGTQIPSQTTTLPTSSTAPLPGDPNLPIGKGGSKTSCVVPGPVSNPYNTSIKPQIYISKDMWDNCLGGRPALSSGGGAPDWTYVTFDNGVIFPSSLFAGIFNNNPPELAYRKAYKVLHFVPFSNNPTVTDPDDPEGAIELPYFGRGAASTRANEYKGDMALEPFMDFVSGRYSPENRGVTALYHNLSYRVRWDVLANPYDHLIYGGTPSAVTPPETVDIYIYQSDKTCGDGYKPNYPVDMMWYQKCRQAHQQRLADDEQNKIISDFGKGYVLVAKNIPYKDGKAQFYMPDPPNVTYPGKVTNRPYVGSGPFEVLVMDSRVTANEAQWEGKGPFLYNSTYYQDAYAGQPILTKQQIAFKTPLASLAVSRGLDILSYSTLSIKMQSVENPPTTSPMPWKVINPGFNESLNFDYHRNEFYKEITIEGGQDRPFWESIYFFGDPPGPNVTFSGQLPSGLRLTTTDRSYFGNGEGGTVGVAAIIGTPSESGEFYYYFRAKYRVGNKTIEGLTKYIIQIRPTSPSRITVEKISGSEGSQIRTGDTVHIVVLNDNGGIAGAVPTLYIAPAGSGCNRNDPRSYNTCQGNVGLHPDFVRKARMSNQLEMQTCNNALSGGSDPLVAWSCSEYNWRVGNIPGADISSGNFVIYALPQELSSNGADFWSATQVNIQPGTATEGNYSQYHMETGAFTMGDYKLRFDCNVNGRDVNCTDAATGFMSYAQGVEYNNNQYVKTSSFNAQPGDTVIINYSSKPRPRNGYTPEPNVVWGTDWSSTIERYATVASNSMTDEAYKRCTESLVPGGFSRQAVDYTGVMNGPEGTVTFVVPECLRGAAFIINYSAYLGCTRTDNNCAFSKQTLRMGIGIGGVGVPGGGDDILQGSCRLPTNLERISCIDPRISGTGSNTSGSYRLKWDLIQGQTAPRPGTVAEPGFGYYLYALSSPNAADVSEANLCKNPGNHCNYNKQVSGYFEPSVLETQDRISTPLDRTNYTKFYAFCPAIPNSAISYWEGPTCAVTRNASGQAAITQEGEVPAGVSETCSINENMFSDLSGSSNIDGTSMSIGYAGISGRYDRLVIRVGTDRDAVIRGCTAEDLSTGRCLAREGDPGSRQYPNGLQGPGSSGITISGTRPDTTYWVRLAAVCDYGLPTQRVVDRVTTVTTNGTCYGVLNNSLGGTCPQR